MTTTEIYANWMIGCEGHDCDDCGWTSTSLEISGKFYCRSCISKHTN